jgi:ribosomal-protein-alanine N-acetyltransferase
MMNTSHPRLVTARLEIRLGTPGDAPIIAGFFSDSASYLVRVQTPRPPAWSTEAFWRTEVERLRREYEADRDCQLFLFPRADRPRVCGQIHLFTFVRGAFQACTCGYAVREEDQGKGLMTEALSAVVDFAFGPLNLHRIMANVRPDNTRSRRLLRRLGFVEEGYAKSYLLQNGVWTDHVLTAKTNDGWSARHENQSPGSGSFTERV